jgi:transmembrane sensor
MTEERDALHDALIDRALRGEASAEEQRTLAEWRAASSINEAEYRAAERIAASARALRFTGAAVAPRPTAADIITRVQANRRESVSRRGTFRLAAAAVAAAALLLIAAGLALRGTGWQPAEIVTGAAELATVKLADGTVVRLAPSSRLRVVGGRMREVALEGRAFFAVTRVPGQPFRVHAGGATANVLGTRFELETAGGDVRLTVVEGRVALAAADRTVEVGAGEASALRDGTLTPPAPLLAEPLTPEWVGKFVTFQTTPLRDAARDIEHTYGVSVLLSDSALADATITATFTDQPVADVMDVVCMVLGATCSWTDTIVTMTR